MFARVGQPAACPWRLALITLLQFSEHLSDRCAADAVRARIDWKYLLGLDLTDPGFDASVLSEFRSRLVAGEAEALLFDTLLTLCRERGLLAKRGRQRTDATHVLGAVRSLNRLGCAIETLRAALNALAVVAPDWLRAHTDPNWIERYGRSIDDFHIPQGETARRACAEAIGDDGHRLLAAVDAKAAPGWLRNVPAMVVLRRVWLQNFHVTEPPTRGSEGDGRIRWRTEAEGIPAALVMVASPYDPDVHYAKKRATTWIGYKVHLTETCDDAQPPLIVHVATTPAPIVDRAVLDPLHAALATKDLLPARHLIDAAYIDADGLVAAARDHDVVLTGPVSKDNQWQARTEGAFTIEAFHLDWDRKIATCPAGHDSRSWHPNYNLGRTVIRIWFAAQHCRACSLKPRCTRSQRRLLTPRSREEHDALVAARARETSSAFAADRRRRAGIEGTLSRGVRTMGLRRSRYLGLARTHLQHLLTATAINLGRLAAWIGDTPAGRTRRSAFARLMAQPAGA
ncbi:Transposase IS4 family [Methylobacterium oryzae CBMB20]|uniref:Transposase IS4 family n=1 Tax=Methylobacterium oryzae CBMB20 TaxID=693986 RepID=A0A089Q415_9HYPH|nr:Transposase IS4 family [Methylobacterium oryzae CBMB20]